MCCYKMLFWMCYLFIVHIKRAIINNSTVYIIVTQLQYITICTYFQCIVKH